VMSIIDSPKYFNNLDPTTVEALGIILGIIRDRKYAIIFQELYSEGTLRNIKVSY